MICSLKYLHIIDKIVILLSETESKYILLLYTYIFEV